MKKICFILTTRGNYGKTKSIIDAIDLRDDMCRCIIGNDQCFRPDIDYKIDFFMKNSDPVNIAQSAAMVSWQYISALNHAKPDAVVIVADRYECLPAAMVAAYMQIPIVHLEGGEVSGSIDESIRHAITKLAHLHFPANQDAAGRIIKMGEDPDTVFPVGGTSLDIVAALDLNINKTHPYLICIFHPVSSEYNQAKEQVRKVAEAIGEIKLPIYWIGPNVDIGIKHILKEVSVIPSMPIERFAPLLANADCIIGNSSSGIREASFLGTPSVNIGNRQQGRGRLPNVIDVQCETEDIVNAIKLQLEHGRYEPDYYYGDGKAGEKIVDILSKFQFKIQKKMTY